MKHSVVYYEPGKFGGWPANCGIWSWGEEILVSYNIGDFLAESVGHKIDRSTMSAGFSRSLDGGLHWRVEASLNQIFARDIKPVPSEGFDFSHPDFALRVGQPTVTIASDLYLVSFDRGRTWDGPFSLPEFGNTMTARTCYHVEGAKRLILFLSHSLPNRFATTYTDRAFAAATTDGGTSWEFVGNMTDDLPRSVMPDVVRLSEGTLVGAMRRRFEYSHFDPEALEGYTRMPWGDDNWIEVRRSSDNGRSWTSAVRAAETSREYGRNGNPPGLTRLQDDTLVLVYGYRGDRPAIKYKVSRDGGVTFEGERILRDDAITPDLGYPRVIVREDGRCVAVYYIATKEMPENHIEATIFDPNADNG